MKRKKCQCVIPAKAGIQFVNFRFKTWVPAFAGTTELLSLLLPLYSAPLDMTVKGEVKEKLEIQRVAPVPDVALKDVVPFTRLGQTDWILSEELGYLDEERQV